MVSLVFFDILQLPHTLISNSEKLTHPIQHKALKMLKKLKLKRFFSLSLDAGIYFLK